MTPTAYTLRSPAYVYEQRSLDPRVANMPSEQDARALGLGPRSKPKRERKVEVHPSS